MIKVQKAFSQAEKWPFVLPMIEPGVIILYFVHNLVGLYSGIDWLARAL